MVAKINKKNLAKPIFTGGIPQLSSAKLCLTSVFGMGTGVTTTTSSPENFYAILKNVPKSHYINKSYCFHGRFIIAPTKRSLIMHIEKYIVSEFRT